MRDHVWTGLLQWSSDSPWIFSFFSYLVGVLMRVTRMTMLVHARVVVHLKMIDAATTVDLVASVMIAVVPIVITRAVETEIDRSSEHEVLSKSLSLLLVFYSYDPLSDESVWVSECSWLVFRAYLIYPRCCSPSSPPFIVPFFCCRENKKKKTSNKNQLFCSDIDFILSLRQK